MRELNAHTKKAQQLIANALHFTGFYLSDIYTYYSGAKERAWEWCYSEYAATENATDFAIGNANTFGFSACWLGTINGERIMRYETKDNSYLVWLDR